MANAQTYREVWQVCLDRIQKHTTQEEFAKWFEPLKPLSFDGTNLRLKVPDGSHAKHIEDNYLKLFSQAIFELFGRQTKLHYAIPSSEEKTAVSPNADITAISQHVTQTNTRNIPDPFVSPGLKKLRYPTQLSPKYTFSTHIEGMCNRLARSAGKTVALTPGSSPFNPF